MAADDSEAGGRAVAKISGRYTVIAAVAGAAVASIGVLVGPLAADEPPASASKLRYFIHYTNTGTTQTDDLTLRVTLPEHMEYVPGTTVLAYSKHPNGAKLSDNITLGGVNVGSWAPGGGGWVRFTAEVTNGKDRPCNSEDLKVEISPTSADPDTPTRSTVQIWAEC
ncbi:hypothetical protein ABZT26_23925 [Streptomyces sp. NPDC005395]|uniref:hypothetical protein n=1 Tax=Streptomyces sp. NPDC005395 TaxID=3157042 RepID=UPI0033AE3562